MPGPEDGHPEQRRTPGAGRDAASETASILGAAGSKSIDTEYYSPSPDGYQKGRHKYVVVLGTVMSGLGKGIFASSLAKLLKDKGLSVAPIKMEGYLNIDAGTLNPYRHGEVFVLDDGTECDMDLGTYERMLDQNLSKRNFTTSGQLYAEILERERRGLYLGRDVQMIPHVTGEVKRKLRELAMRGGESGDPVDVVIVEVGGTVGDYENGFYIEALRELAFEEGEHSTCFVALTYIIEPPSLGEQKSKAAQLGIQRLMEAGIQPHLIACRATNEVGPKVREKIGMFSNVPFKRIYSLHDRDSVYSIPHELRSEGLDREILGVLNLHDRVDVVGEDRARDRWGAFIARLNASRQRSVRIGVTGKYAELRDAYASIEKALEHSGIHLGARVDIDWIETTDLNHDNAPERLEVCDGVIVPGGFGRRGVSGKIACVHHCRTAMIPYLGICLGFQVAVIEFARSVLGHANATSTEFDPNADIAVISELPDQKKIEGLGGTMRLGAQDVLVSPGSLASRLFAGSKMVRERFRHRWEVDPTYIERFEAAGLHFTGRHPQHPIMQILELRTPADATAADRQIHPYFVAAQFHPELTSRPLKPQPMFLGLVAAAIRRRYERAGDWSRIASDPALKRWLGIVDPSEQWLDAASQRA